MLDPHLPVASRLFLDAPRARVPYDHQTSSKPSIAFRNDKPFVRTANHKWLSLKVTIDRQGTEQVIDTERINDMFQDRRLIRAFRHPAKSRVPAVKQKLAQLALLAPLSLPQSCVHKTSKLP